MFYIDIGCNDPFGASVTKLYYDMGAHGINIDPVQEYIQLANRERPRDINLCLGVGAAPGEIEMFINGGLTTMREDLVDGNGCVGKRVVRIDTLANICREYVPEGQPIHLLKIDVEGFESQVIQGMDWQTCHPWVLCIESTLPCTDVPCYDEWEHDVLVAGYQLAFTYGVNRYYVANEKQELVQRFLPVEQILQNYYVFQATLNRM